MSTRDNWFEVTWTDGLKTTYINLGLIAYVACKVGSIRFFVTDLAHFEFRHKDFAYLQYVFCHLRNAIAAGRLTFNINDFPYDEWKREHGDDCR